MFMPPERGHGSAVPSAGDGPLVHSCDAQIDKLSPRGTHPNMMVFTEVPSPAESPALLVTAFGHADHAMDQVRGDSVSAEELLDAQRTLITPKRGIVAISNRQRSVHGGQDQTPDRPWSRLIRRCFLDELMKLLFRDHDAITVVRLTGHLSDRMSSMPTSICDTRLRLRSV